MVRTNWCLIVCTVLVTLTVASDAYPWRRVKRVSDQRLAELETLLALAARMKGRFVTVPIGYGLVDPNRVGKRKRSLNVFEYDMPDRLTQFEEDAEADRTQDEEAEDTQDPDESSDFPTVAFNDYPSAEDNPVANHRMRLPTSSRRGREPYYDWRAIASSV